MPYANEEEAGGKIAELNWWFSDAITQTAQLQDNKMRQWLNHICHRQPITNRQFLEVSSLACMRYAPLLLNEPDRLAKVAEYQLKEDDGALDLEPIVQLASRLFDAPIVLVSIVEETRQIFSARKGIDVCETARDVSFCAHALGLDDVLVVPDAKLDVRFAQNPLVLG